MFHRSVNSGVSIWRGNPHCDQAHQQVLAWLTANCLPFLPHCADPPHNILVGNLGESISFCVGVWHVFRPPFRPFPANALSPFRGIARPDIDILWTHFSDDPNNDSAVVQEVKCTTTNSLSITGSLSADYSKLFGTDIQLTLHTRLQGLKAVYRYTLNAPEYLPRLTALAGNRPETSPRILLLPTLVHDFSLTPDPTAAMLGVRETLHGAGWPRNSIDPWAIGLSSLRERIVRLATGN